MPPGMDAWSRLLDQVRNDLRALHCNYRTEQQCVFRVPRLILFHGKRHPADMSAAEIEPFLTQLAVDRQVSASTLNQALVVPTQWHRWGGAAPCPGRALDER